NLPDEAPQGGLKRLENQSRIVFDKVCFSYAQPAHGYDLGPVTLSVGRGETLGVIGATGSGKTTLIQLLQRFYPPDEGAIYVDGENIAGMEEARLHGLFGVAFQSDAFFAGTIDENIDLGRGLPREAIEKAARCAQAEEFILATPEGYEHPVRAKAVNLSGGQKQRLLIARALAGNPEILILDDSSSALDYRTDAMMRSAVRQEYPDTSLLLVAQRVSSVKNADQILVLEEGRMAGLGTHEALLRDCPLYAQIAKIQMGGDDDAAA
ncbi:MAG: ABC transporter ATP-binding protein, partial [Eubacteriales bacterium]|nr:ABC transporter ATP-binding protein [Eubacteriales bacterium]